MQGFLIIDPQKNTVVVPVRDEFLTEVFRNKEIYNSIKKHKTQAELLAEVKSYLKGGEGDA